MISKEPGKSSNTLWDRDPKPPMLIKSQEKGYQYTDNKEIADICNKHFVSIGERLAEGIPDTSDSPTADMKPTNCRFVFRKVTTSQVERVIKKLVNAKATGVHNIPNKILKDSCQTIAQFLSDIFDLSISTNTFPNDLRIGKVSPAHKSGDRDDLNNYRPMSVLPTIARVFERLLYNQMYTYLTDNKLLEQQQFGFRSIHSTALAMGNSINQWLMNVNSGELNSVVFLDIKKAFDTVNHGVLLQNLACYGIKDNSLKLIESYLKDRMQCCSVNGELSSMECIVFGVPQGSILGPLLFILYINDLPEYVPDVDITMFADDTSFAKGLKNVNEIQEHLVNMESIIVEDTNCDYFDKSANDTSHLLKIINTFNLKQTISDYTRITATTKTCIGHIITNKPVCVLDSGVLPCGINDHDAVFMVKNMRAPKLKLPPQSSSVRNYKKLMLKPSRMILKTYLLIRSKMSPMMPMKCGLFGNHFSLIH